jgi:hypothetical protein
MADYRCALVDCIGSVLVKEAIGILRIDSLELREDFQEQNDEKDRKKCYSSREKKTDNNSKKEKEM